MPPLTDAQQALVEKAARFAGDNADILLSGKNRLKKARDIYEAYALEGYHALLIPEEFGGQGLDFTTTGLIFETLNYHLPGTLHGPVTTAHCTEMMKIGLRGETKSSILTAIAREGLAAAFCLTEEGAGSDISAITTTARKTEIGLIIRGKKGIVINHAIASYFIVFAESTTAKGRAGMNAILVNPSLRGVNIGSAYDSPDFSLAVMGEVAFNDVAVPKEAIMGEDGKGYLLLMETLDKGRPLVAACCAGSARKVFDMVLKHVKARSQFGKPLFSFQGISFPLAEYATRLQASRLLAYDALERIRASPWRPPWPSSMPARPCWTSRTSASRPWVTAPRWNPTRSAASFTRRSS